LEIRKQKFLKVSPKIEKFYSFNLIDSEESPVFSLPFTVDSILFSTLTRIQNSSRIVNRILEENLLKSNQKFESRCQESIIIDSITKDENDIIEILEILPLLSPDLNDFPFITRIQEIFLSSASLLVFTAKVFNYLYVSHPESRKQLLFSIIEKLSITINKYEA